MYNWTPYCYMGRYQVNGTAENHPKLGDFVYIAYTTSRQNAYIENETLYYETRNTLYVCPLKYLNTINPFVNVLFDYVEELAAMNSEDCVDKIIKSLAEIAIHNRSDKKITFSDYTQYLIEISKNANELLEQNKKNACKNIIDIAKKYKNCIYLEVKNIENGSLLAYHIGKKSGYIEPSVHSGMFQDSILYIEPSVVDFRYFPKLNEIETYSWSDNIEVAIFKNCMSYTIRVNKHDIEPNATISLTIDSHKQELISPDFVSGKSAFNISGEKNVTDNDKK